MTVHEHFPLKHLNTFGIDVNTRYFTEVYDTSEILSFLCDPVTSRQPLLLLGGGSNLLFTEDFPGTVLKISTKGIRMLKQENDFVFVRVEAGEKWDDFVRFCVECGWGGVENLSSIPGNVGAAPVQNIGAYDVELKDLLISVDAIDLQTTERQSFTRDQCEFGYRESIFNRKFSGRYLILDVVFRLNRRQDLNLDYGNIREELGGMDIANPTIQSVRDAVIRIRRRKLPDPLVLGNAGSFFRNPVVDRNEFIRLAELFPGIPSFPFDGRYKIPAAWMIDQCGWKGKHQGRAGVHDRQPLVLVNLGNATGTEILELADAVRQSVYDRFGIMLIPEVNVIPSATRQ